MVNRRVHKNGCISPYSYKRQVMGQGKPNSFIKHPGCTCRNMVKRLIHKKVKYFKRKHQPSKYL